jgi:hypothetical protein
MKLIQQKVVDVDQKRCKLQLYSGFEKIAPILALQPSYIFIGHKRSKGGVRVNSSFPLVVVGMLRCIKRQKPAIRSRHPVALLSIAIKTAAIADAAKQGEDRERRESK